MTAGDKYQPSDNSMSQSGLYALATGFVTSIGDTTVTIATDRALTPPASACSSGCVDLIPIHTFI